jgi:hypothetical protein
VSQLVVESLLIATAGAAAAIPAALVSARALVTLLETPAIPIDLSLGVNWRLIAFIAAAAVVTTVLFGLVPALRVSMVDPSAATRATSRGHTVDRRRARLQRGLVAGQIALSLVLVVSALMFVRSFRNLSTVDLGFEPDRVVVAGFLDLSASGLTTEQRIAFQQELTAAIGSLPGVASAASSTHVPMSGNAFSHYFRVPGVGEGETKTSRFIYVSPGYFDTMKIPIREGRDFDEHDRASSRRVLLVNDSFVRHHLGSRPAIGATVRTMAEPSYPETMYEIIGVVADTKYNEMRSDDCLCDAGSESKPPVAYVPIAQNPNPQPWAPVMVQAGGPMPASPAPSFTAWKN